MDPNGPKSWVSDGYSSFAPTLTCPSGCSPSARCSPGCHHRCSNSGLPSQPVFAPSPLHALPCPSLPVVASHPTHPPDLLLVPLVQSDCEICEHLSPLLEDFVNLLQGWQCLAKHPSPSRTQCSPCCRPRSPPPLSASALARQTWFSLRRPHWCRVGQRPCAVGFQVAPYQ